MNGAKEHRPVADAALGARQRHPHVDIRDRRARTDQIVSSEAAQQADRVPAEIECRDRRTGTAGGEPAPHTRVAPRTRKGDAACHDDVPARHALKAPQVDDRRAAVGVRSERRAGHLCGRFDPNTFLGTDRIAVGAAAVVDPSATKRSTSLFRR